MLLHRLTHGSIIDPRQLRVLGEVFDAAWAQIGPTLSAKASSTDAARTKLASTVLQIARDGVTTPEQMLPKVLDIAFAEPTELHEHKWPKYLATG